MAKRPVAAATILVCPRCNTASRARLAPGELCATCKAQEAWTQHEGKQLVIDHASIDDALVRRAGEAAGEPIWRRALAWLPVAVTGVAAVASAYFVFQLLSSRSLGPLGTLLAELATAWKIAMAIGAVALVSGIVALVRARRSRHFRKLPMLASHLLAIALGSLSLGVGGFHGLSMIEGFGGRYTTMPEREQLNVAPHVQRIIDATVVLLATDAEGDARGGALGTGAVIARDAKHAWIVTCSHVAIPYISPSAFRDPRTAQPVWVQLADGREGKATVRWAAPPPLDVALVEFEIDNPPEPVPIAPDASELTTAAPVTFVPNPYRAGWMVTHGKVVERRSHNTPAGVYALLLTDLPVQHGDSGSGLFDARGQLVGLNTWQQVGGGPATGISLPSETMRVVIDAIHSGSIDRLLRAE